MTDKENDFDESLRLVMADRDARVALRENQLRRKISEVLERARDCQDFTLSEVAKQAGISLTQARRALGKGVGGDLTLNTLMRVADLFQLNLDVALNYLLPNNGKGTDNE